jgi:hypothetical protein
MLDVVLFGALKKHATGLELLNEESGKSALILKLDHGFKRAMVEVNRSGAFSAMGSPITLPRIRTDCFSITKRSDNVSALWNCRSATRGWRACRRGVNGPCLDGLIN